MHEQDAATQILTQAVVRYAVERMELDPPPLDHPRPESELATMVGQTITAEGLGGLEALRLFADILAPACLSIDHPSYLSFVPAAPTEAAILFDLVVGATSVYAGSWLEGSGAVFAENQALRWLADLARFPSSAGGVFVAGGSAGNLSALVAARFRWRRDDPTRGRQRAAIIAGSGAHSSVAAAARVMDADVIRVPSDSDGRLTRAALSITIDSLSDDDRARTVAIVATAGSTNAGVVDDIAAAADAAATLGVWLHVDAAYGGAALCAPSARARFDGIERADSFVVDPHKWLFAPYDCAALIYRDPAVARATFTQHAEYLDVLTDADGWNPSDYAYHLTRRARGLPFWFSLATYGTTAYAQAVEASLTLAVATADMIRAREDLELLVEPELSIVVFGRRGWTAAQYQRWSDELLESGTAFVVPTSWKGRPALRFCFVNPRTTVADVTTILDTLRSGILDTLRSGGRG